ncbi:MAG: V-type ATP synthase subunit F [Clostridia bacterium]|nr:V-type ATP synthase subunit F [Clostridia bacterium]
MKFFVISDDRDTLTGMHLAGIEGKFCEKIEEAEQAMLEATKDSSIGILMITDSIAAAFPETVSHIKLNYSTPLLVEIPNSDGADRPNDSILKIVHEVIGI